MKVLPWALVGFAVGAGIGFMFGKKASSNFDGTVTTNVSGGKAVITFDAKKFVEGGLPDFLRRF